jgi:hypothetical protein
MNVLAFVLWAANQRLKGLLTKRMPIFLSMFHRPEKVALAVSTSLLDR